MQLQPPVLFVINKIENKFFLYDRKEHLEYEINESMAELIENIHTHNILFEEACSLYGEEIILTLIDYHVLDKEDGNLGTTKNNIRYIENVTPSRLFIEITDNCNLCCRHCYGNYSNVGLNYIPFEELSSVITDARNSGVYEVDLTGGEPLLHPKFVEILKLLFDNGMVVSVFSNLTLLSMDHIIAFNDYGVKKIITSIDSTNSDTHDWFRGKDGAYASTISNIKQLQKYSRCEIIANLVIGNHNYQEIVELVSMINHLGISCVLDVINCEGRAELLTENPIGMSKIIAEYYQSSELNITNNMKYCGVGKKFVYVKPNGDVFLCPNLISNEYNLGNCFEQSILDIFEDMISRFGNIHCSMMNSNCASCSGGCRARALKSTGNLCGRDPVYCTFVGGK